MMKKNLFYCLFAVFVLSLPFCPVLATSILQEKINTIIKNQPADIGVSIESPAFGHSASFHADKSFPMQEVVRFPLALAILDAVDKGKLRLDDTILLTADIPLYNIHHSLPEEDALNRITLREILEKTISSPENKGGDILFRLLSGPETVNRYVKKLGIEGIEIHATEEQAHRSWNAQFENTATPAATNQLLHLFQQKKLLSASSHELLWRIMSNSMTGAGRLREPLPAGAILVHKTGTGETSLTKGTTVNDIGIILIPSGQPVFISVFITHAPDSIMETEKTIAALAQAAWEYYSVLPRHPLTAAQRSVKELFHLEN